MTRLFIDGSEGTTALQLRERLAGREEYALMTLPEEERKDPSRRREMLNACDIAILCLPDKAALEAVALLENPRVRVIDASTTHRCTPGWVYGYPEIMGRESVTSAARVSVPGCHAAGVIALLYPLRRAGLLRSDARVSVTSLTGYSGGGRKMIAAYEDPARPAGYASPRLYALEQLHKHLPEITRWAELDCAPAFMPVVGDFPRGMVTVIPVFGMKPEALLACYEASYPGPVVRRGAADGDGCLAANALAGKDAMEILVTGNDERALVIARFDNLGKGASGAALQCLNLMTGQAETKGLVL